MFSGGTLPPRKPAAVIDSKELGAFARLCRERKGLTQAHVAELAGMRGPQVSLLETGANVEVQFYERVARALGFRHSLEMFTAGGDEKTRRLLRLWKALPDEEARDEALTLMRDVIVADEEPSARAISKPLGGSQPERKRKEH